MTTKPGAPLFVASGMILEPVTSEDAVLSPSAPPPSQDTLQSPFERDVSAEDGARLRLLGLLDDRGYDFTAPTPTTHRRVMLRRRRAKPGDLTDIFGWSRRFKANDADPELVSLLDAGGVLERRGCWLRSRISVSRAGGRLFMHSALPASDEEHVFFGPDSYRFIDFIRAEFGEARPGLAIADIGAGAGVGGIFAAGQVSAARLLLTDVNAEALRLAQINATFAGLSPALQRCEGLPQDAQRFDLIVANPPYIAESGLPHSDGGGGLGADISIAWARSAVSRLKPGGRFLLYSGSAIVDGHDALKAALAEVAGASGCTFAYRELDPDVFPGQLAHPAYWKVERLAAIGAVLANTNA